VYPKLSAKPSLTASRRIPGKVLKFAVLVGFEKSGSLEEAKARAAAIA